MVMTESTVLLHDLAPCLLKTLVNEYSGTDTVVKEEPQKDIALPIMDYHLDVPLVLSEEFFMSSAKMNHHLVVARVEVRYQYWW